MKKLFRRYVPLVVILGIAVALFCLIVHPLEPRYNGKRLSEWTDVLLESVRFDPFEQDDAVLAQEQATHAIQAIGAKAIPYGMKWCRAKNTVVNQALRELFDDGDSFLMLKYVSVGHIHARSWKLFQALGPAGKSAIPELAQLLGNDDRGIASTAVSDLAYIGIDSIPTLLIAATNQNVRTREDAIVCLGNIGNRLRVVKATTPSGRARYILEKLDADKQPAIQPVRATLVRSLQDPEMTVRRASAVSLTQCDTEPAVAVPALITALQKETNNLATNYLVRTYCSSLGYYGTNARPAVPLLIKIVETRDTNQFRFRRGGTRFRTFSALAALRQIDPVVAQPYWDDWMARQTNR